MATCQLVDAKIQCPLPLAEDRLLEAFHVAGRFDEDYHDPQKFRFNLNALVTAITAVKEILQKEVETTGKVHEWNAARQPFKSDKWLAAVKRARDTTLHQRAIFDGSRVEIGLYRNRRHKLSLGAEIPGDVHSTVLLEQWTKSSMGQIFLSPEHDDVGEQYGVWRRYYVKELSTSEDALTAVRRGLIRAVDMIVSAHALYDVGISQFPDQVLLDPQALAAVSVLLESDVDPSLPAKWGWTGG